MTDRVMTRKEAIELVLDAFLEYAARDILHALGITDSEIDAAEALRDVYEVAAERAKTPPADLIDARELLDL